MPSYPISIRRFQHIKVNGTQCGSPALCDQKYCYYHLQCHQKNMEINMNLQGRGTIERGTITLPTLEDANSIQVGLAEVMRLLVTNQIDHRTAALLLHALRTASANIKRISLEPEPTHVVIDRDSVERRPIGSTAWSTVAGREYDQIENDDVENNKPVNEDGECGADLMRLIDLAVADPEYLEKRASDLRAKQERQELRRFHAGLPLR
jgi:hypothetical protein